MKARRVGRGTCPRCGKSVQTYTKDDGVVRFCIHNPPLSGGAEEQIIAKLTFKSQVCPGSRLQAE